jgi:hypothetical protein
MDAAKSCLDLVALLRQNKVSQSRLKVTSIDAAKSCLDLVALLRHIKVSQLRLMATSMDTRAASTSWHCSLLRENTEQGESMEAYSGLHGHCQELPRPRGIAQTEQGESMRLIATSMDAVKSCLDLVALLRQNKVSN